MRKMLLAAVVVGVWGCQSEIVEGPAVIKPRLQPPKGLRTVEDATYPSVEELALGSREAQDRQRETVKRLGLPLEVKNSIGMRFRLIPAGTFMMGSPEDEAGRFNGEQQHEVTLTRSYYIGSAGVTQQEWMAVMGENPSHFDDNNQPVVNVSWDDCQTFIQKLCQLEGVSDGTYCLPTEAEWEYACRAGTGSAFYSGDCTEPNGLDPARDRIGWNYWNSGVGFHPVRQKDQNAWGLYDMSGTYNVYEWCGDWFGPYEGDTKNPSGPHKGSHRVCRGGGRRSLAFLCRSAYRCMFTPDKRSSGLGFRLLRTIA